MPEKCPACGKFYYPESTGEGACHFECEECGKSVQYASATWYQINSGCCEECFGKIDSETAFNAMAVSLLHEIQEFTSKAEKINPRLHALLEKIELTINRVKEWF
jgi:hypothetical protein